MAMRINQETRLRREVRRLQRKPDILLFLCICHFSKSALPFYAEVAGTSAEIRGKLAAQRKERNLPFQDVF